MAPTTGAIPPPLAPSVEESYRRKCIQLRQRTNEVEESNDHARQRLVRLRLEIEKTRLERAFLLENLAKRTSTNVEDSEGSPSPPPTPKEKPLRTKRGHRKPSFLHDAPSIGAAFGTGGGSPSSETFSHTHLDAAPTTHPLSNPKPNGYSNVSGGAGPARRPKNSFELYCNENRASLADELEVEKTLAEGFRGMNQDEKNAIQARFEALRKSFEVENGSASGHGGENAAEVIKDEDVEMGDDIEAEAETETLTAGDRA